MDLNRITLLDFILNLIGKASMEIINLVNIIIKTMPKILLVLPTL